MEFIVKPFSNAIEFSTHRGMYVGKHKGKYAIRSISIMITSDKPDDLKLMMINKKPIEKAIITELNKNFMKGRKNEKD